MYSILIILLLFISSTADAIMDVISFHFSKSIFSKMHNWKIFKKKTYKEKLSIYRWCNPDYSWKNKWKNGNKEEGEIFKGSSTIFVFVTDLWHLMQFIQLNSLFLLSVVFLLHLEESSFKSIILHIFLYRVYYGINFTLWYDHILKLKK